MADGWKASFAKLGNGNYASWKFRMRSLLEREDLWNVIEQAKPEENDDDYDDWRKSDVKARATIALFVEDSQLRFVKKCETARQMWENLRVYHEKATIGNQVMLLQQLCSKNLCEGGDVEKHLEEFECLYERLDNAGVELSELLRIIMMLRSLPSSYSSFVTSLENRPQEDLTMDLVVARLRDEYQKRAGLGDNSESALRAFDRGRSEKKCFYCSKPGHFKKNCRKFLAEKGGESASDSRKSAGSNQLVKQKAKQAQAENGGADRSKQVVADSVVCGAVCFMAGDVIPGAWTIDSGCTCHMTNDRGFFVELKHGVVVDVTLADGTKTKSTAVGSGVIMGVNGKGERIAITLENVLLVPSLEGGLISVRKLATKGLTVVFGATGCSIKAANDSVLAVGELVGNQYKLKLAEQCLAVAGSHGVNCQHTWHRRMGHRDISVVNAIVTQGLASGIKVTDCGERIVCECCLRGKLVRKPFPQVQERKSKRPLDIIHTDLCGPMEHPTPSGNRYFITLIDDYSRFCVVFLLKSKDEAAEKIMEYVRWVENIFNRKPCVLRSDGGGEYIGERLKQFCRSEGIQQQFSTPYSPQSNGVAERKNRSLQEMASCMLLDANLPKRYWGEAILTATFIQNRLPSRAVDKTPFELWTGSQPNLKDLRIFGCEAYVRVPDAKRKKFDPRSKKLVFVGYSGCHKGYRFLDVETDRIIVSRDAEFLELVNGSEQKEEASALPEMQREEQHVPDDSAAESEETPVVVYEHSEDDEMQPEEHRSVYEDAEDTIESDFPDIEELSGELELPDEPVLNRQDRRTRGVLPNRYEDYIVGQVLHGEEPNDFRDALSVPVWQRAMREEIEAHKVNSTWELADLPPGKKAIGAKWVFKIKRDETGSVVKHKARIVAQGYSQCFGVDFTEVYAPVTRQATLRVLLAIAGKKQFILKQYDVRTAYLNGTVDEELYMQQPPGFAVPGHEHKVCKLRKSIYGLRQSARCWNKALHAALLELKFKPSTADPCLYIRYEEPTVVILVYVDDLLIGSVVESEIDKVFEGLRKKFDVTSLGSVRHFLGYEIEKQGRYYTLRLSAYIDTLLGKFNMENCRPSKTPMDPGYTSTNEDSKRFDDPTLYRSLVGALLYLAVNARPDLSLSVGLLGRKVSEPNNMDWCAAKRVLQYLRATRDWRLVFGPGEGWRLRGFSDSDWAGDRRTRKSTTGFIFFYGSGAISWVSKGQSSVALSSLEAEYNALSLTCQETVWLRRLLLELGEPEGAATVVFEDNQGCLSFATSERTSGRVKHIDTKRHYIRELAEKEVIKLVYCPTTEMVADALTKPLGPTAMQKFIKQVGLKP